MNLYAYRLPGTTEIKSGSSERLHRGFCCGGFAVVPFDGSIDGIFTIPADTEGVGALAALQSPDSHEVCATDSDDSRTLYPFPAESTSPDEHGQMVRTIVESIKSGQLTKCVASRVITDGSAIDVQATFHALCRAYPDAFVFTFHTPETGTWIGASPETLLIKEGRSLRTMSLAGKRHSGTGGEWDEKNIGEQRIVTDYICDTLRQCGLDPEEQPTTTRRAGPVEHIVTEISATLPENGNAAALEAALRLSPTPALAGFPKQSAIGMIERIEKHQRGYYGGFCGPIADNGDFRFYVNLRSARIKNARYCLFAGGGIVADSEPSDEWEETRRKSATLLEHLITK